MHQCQGKHWFERMIKKGADPFERQLHYDVGTQVHSALEFAVNYLNRERPAMGMSTEILERLLVGANAAADTRLTLPLAKAQRQYVRDTIREVGSYLINDEMEDVTLMPERVVQSKSVIAGRHVGGILDLGVLYTDKKSKEKVFRILDYKNQLERMEAGRFTPEYLAKFPTTKEALQSVIYPFSVLDSDSPLLDQVNRVETFFAVNEGNHLSMIKSGSLERDSVKAVQSKIALMLSKEEANRQIFYERELALGQSGIKQRLSRIINTREYSCSAAACTTCPARLYCRQRFLIEATGSAERRGVEGTSFPRNAEYERIVDELKLQSHDPRVEERLTESERKLAVETYREKLAQHNMDVGRASSVDQSLRALDKMRTSEFVDEGVENALRSTARAPLSMLDSDIETVWLGQRTKRATEWFLRNRVREIAPTLGVKPELIENEVLQGIGTSKEFTEQIRSYMMRRAQSEVVRAGMKVTPSNVTRALARADLILNEDYVHMFDRELSENVVRTILRTHSHALKDYTKYADHWNIKTITDGVVGDRLITPLDAKATVAQLARAETPSALVSRYSLSERKFPARPAAALLFLTYLAGANAAQNLVGRRLEKLSFYESQDDRVRTADHASPVSEARRIVLSDFGSAYRGLFASISSRLSALRTSLSPRIDRLRKEFAALSSHNMLAQWLNEEVDLKIARGIPSLLESPGFLFGTAAAAGFTIASLMHWPKSPRAVSDREEYRNRRLKQIKEQNWNRNSSMLVPESDLRQSYMLHLPFFHAVSMNLWRPILREIASSRIVSALLPEQAQELWKSGAGMLSGFQSRLREAMGATVHTKPQLLLARFTSKSAHVSPRALLPVHEADTAYAVKRELRRGRLVERTAVGEVHSQQFPRARQIVLNARSRKPAALPVIAKGDPQLQTDMIPVFSRARRHKIHRVSAPWREDGTPLDRLIASPGGPSRRVHRVYTGQQTPGHTTVPVDVSFALRAKASPVSMQFDNSGRFLTVLDAPKTALHVPEGRHAFLRALSSYGQVRTTYSRRFIPGLHQNIHPIFATL
jgi:hypothetical protein